MKSLSKSTISQVAKTAKVSIATVSRVMNHRDLVKPETVEKVINAMKATGYEMNSFSETRTKSGGLIIVNIPSMDNPFYSEIIKGVKASTSRHGYHVLFNEDEITDSTFERLSYLIKDRSVTGMITLNFIPAPLLSKLSSVVPLVQCCEYSEEFENIPYVAIDNFMAAKTVMDHLLSTGRRKIAFLSGPLRYKYARQRKDAYLKSLEYAGIENNSNWIIHLPTINFDIALSAATQLLRSSNPPDAIFTVSDLCASAVIKAARRLGISVPRDLIVTGFDNVDISITTNPSITTVNLPRFQLGYIASDFLVELIENPSAVTQKMLLSTELIIRESTSIEQTSATLTI